MSPTRPPGMTLVRRDDGKPYTADGPGTKLAAAGTIHGLRTSWLAAAGTKSPRGAASPTPSRSLYGL